MLMVHPVHGEERVEPIQRNTRWQLQLPEQGLLASIHFSHRSHLGVHISTTATGCLKKLSFANLSIWRSCCHLGRNTYDFRSKSANAQIGKTQFF